MNYILGALLIVLAAASFAFLRGSTAVFIGIFGAVAGAVFIIRGIQANNTAQDPRQIELDSLNQQFEQQFDQQYGTEISQDYDWDAHYQRNFGDGNADGAEGGRR